MSKVLVVAAGQHSQGGIREINEDACGIRIPSGGLLESKGVAAVIADGVSSCEAGREASETCVQGFLSDYYSTPESWTVKTSARRVLGAVNHWLCGQASRGGGPGLLTTASAVVLKSASAHLFHVGDTRIYRLRDGELERLTRDHRVRAAGGKTFLGRAMGVEPSLEMDYRHVALERDDCFLLTTDGVHDYLADAELCELLHHLRHDPEVAARALVARALDADSQDNCTCQVLRIEAVPYQGDEEAFYQRLTELPFPPPLEPGMVLDGYRILDELHASKRTQIYLAVEPDTGRRVVLKTPSPNYDDDPRYIDRFLHEEWVGRRIDNPHVLKVIEPRHRRSCLYYITEHAPGQDLRQWMVAHPKPALSVARGVLGQIARGLRAFHRLEMVHQDLKPENIRIGTDGTVKLIDFGSTRIPGIEEIATPLGAADQEALGTAGYTAPEYARDGRGTKRSDIYSLGVIAYEMLGAHLPYGPEPPLRRSARPRYVPVSTHNADVPAWVDTVLARAVHLNPGLRYGELSEFIHDLSHPDPRKLEPGFQPLLERDPVVFWRRLAVGTLLLNLMGGLGLLAWM